MRRGADHIPIEELIRRGEKMIEESGIRAPSTIKDSTNSRCMAAALDARRAESVLAAQVPLPDAGPLHLVTMGDSTIDNLIWQDKEGGLFKVADSVVGQLRSSLAASARFSGSIVTNLAADGFTSGNVLNGAPPMLSCAAWQGVGEAFPVEADSGVLKPLDQLDAALQGSPAPGVVLLSVGGNDIREILLNMSLLVLTYHSF
jgi:hypothetical protein